MSDCSSFQQTFLLLQLCLGLIMCLHFIPSYARNNVRSCWCCSRLWIILQKLNRATIWKNGRLARMHLNCPFFMGEGFKGKHWNGESRYTWNHLVHLTKFSIFKSGSSIYQFPFFSSSPGYSIPTTSPTAWESEGESFHAAPTPTLGGTIPLLTELFPSIWVQFAYEHSLHR